MVFSSAIYSCKVTHTRLSPKQHKFWYSVYMFYLDLDELDTLDKKLQWFSRNRFNLFSFRDHEHLQLPKEAPDRSKNTREHLERYVAENGVGTKLGKIMLLTNLNVLGYNFNPVSFYFCFDQNDHPVCTVVEISNTYREMKLFCINKDHLEKDTFKKREVKYFYVSPFIDHDMLFDFKLSVPGDSLNIRIDDVDRSGNRFFISTLTGKKKELSSSALLGFFFKMPIIPLQVMALIHWQALKLWLKKLPYHPKAKNPELQRDVYKEYKP